MSVLLKRRKTGIGSIRDWFTFSRASLLFPVAVVLAWYAGRALGAGGPSQGVILALAGVALAAPFAHAFVVRRIGHGFLAVEAPILLLLLSTLVFRERTANELEYNPLDPAAQFRVACILGALILGGLALISENARSGTESRSTTLPLRLYVLYVVVVFAGAPLSLNPTLTAYRGLELATAVVVILAARRTVGEDATVRIERVLYWSVVALIASVWLGLLLAPAEATKAFLNTYVPIQWQIEGVFPVISSNGVGTLGVILAVWSLGHATSKSNPLRKRWAYTLAATGMVTLFAAQYRTGYLALMGALGVLLVLKKRLGLAVLLVGAAITFVAWSPSVVTEASPYVLRGQTLEQAEELSSRIDWWREGVSVWRTSPIIGRGLLTGTRFEVLARLGHEETAAIHSTWVEALVGTGVLGLALLALSFLITSWRSVVEALRSGWMTPVILLAALGIRTITGNTLESFSYQALIFLWLAVSLHDVSPIRGLAAGGSHPAH